MHVGILADGARRCWLAAIVGLLLVLASLPAAPGDAHVAAWQTTPLAEDPGAGSPLAPVASGETTLPAKGAEVVWLVQSEPAQAVPGATDADFPLELVLASRSIPRMHGEHGAFRAQPTRDRETLLAPGEATLLASATADYELAVRIALVPLASLPDELPPGAIISQPFAAPGEGRLRLELRRGMLAAGQQTSIPVSNGPALLLAVDDPIRLAPRSGGPIALVRGEITLLSEATTIRNPGARAATFVIAWIAPNANDSDPAATVRQAEPGDHDPEIDEAWQRHGCHLNPGNPACLTVALAASCAVDHSGPGCAVDSDADTCVDVAEVRAGFDPFDAADCVGGRDGRPLLNCLFLAGNLACDGSRTASGEAEQPPIDCGLRERDPACDGFAPQPG